MASAHALAHRNQARLRKEFEKWALLTYTNNRAVVNDKKGADARIDEDSLFQSEKQRMRRLFFRLNIGGVKRGDIATLKGDMDRENAALAVHNP